MLVIVLSRRTEYHSTASYSYIPKVWAISDLQLTTLQLQLQLQLPASLKLKLKPASGADWSRLDWITPCSTELFGGDHDSCK